MKFETGWHPNQGSLNGLQVLRRFRKNLSPSPCTESTEAHFLQQNTGHLSNLLGYFNLSKSGSTITNFTTKHFEIPLQVYLLENNRLDKLDWIFETQISMQVYLL